ncbi:TetR/AcrR family transcriptional regulator [Paracoccus aerodenitrificans]|uniref:TetR/AcrR family transcriptional regulator n=1 Tax=Paracoccus aerodenitrificans TaxID=3017781 RepID=UPI0022F0008E|nr:TetR/AcrR family transcriptional regulator [Paracoccus aerodenitrificans]WBU64988.1 TetR/AcrR family transcriptional regulator [Paracoccus aerodenitrificans]
MSDNHSPEQISLNIPKAKPRRTRAQLREQTLAAARTIILEDGPEALTARRLAQAVGYTPGTIYNLFDSLPHVLWEVNRAHFERIASLFSNLPDGDPETRLRTLATRYLDLVEAEPTLFRALFDGPRRSEEFPDWYLNAISTLLDQTAAELISLAPYLSKRIARREATMIYAGVQGIASLRSSRRLELLTRETATDLADCLLQRVLRDLRKQNS